MNELCRLFQSVNDGDTLVLENKTYHIRQDDSFEFEGYYCSNTAKKHENPNGMRRTAMYLKEKKNITVEGNGASVIVHGKMTPFLFDRCDNITVRNLTVDYACPTMSEFVVTAEENGEYFIKINSECLFRIEGNSLIWQGEKGSDGLPYWEDSYIGDRRHIKEFHPSEEITRDFSREKVAFEKIRVINEHTLAVTLADKNSELKVGCIYQTRNIVRDQTGALFQRCRNLVFDSLRIKFMHGLGMVSQFCENITYKNCDFTPADGRTIASTADFFQFSGCKGNIVIDNCKAFGAQDDYVNVHGTHLRIVEKNDIDRSVVVRFMHNESWGFQAYEAGDELEFIKWDTLIPYSKATVVSYERINDTDIRLFLNTDLPDIKLEKDVVENITWTPNLYVRNCDFGTTWGRGILCTTRGEVIIENNRFCNLCGPALLLEDDCNFWFESGYTETVIFRNNSVIGCHYGDFWENSPVIRYTPKVMDENSAEYVHGKLIVTGNSFEMPRYGKHTFHLEYLREADIRGNHFDAPLHIYEKCVGKILK